MALGMGLSGFRVLSVAVLVAIGVSYSGVASAHALLVQPVPRDQTDTKLKMGPCGGDATNGPLVKKAPVIQYQPGATIDIDYKETIGHQGCYLFQLSTTGDDKNFTMLKLPGGANAQVADPAGAGGNLKTQLVLPAGVTCQNCTLRLIQVMLGANCAANQDPTATSNYYSCADIRIGDFSDAGAVMDAGPPNFDASTQDPAESGEGSTTTPTDGGGNTSSSSGDDNGATPSSRNLQAGKGDDCSIGFGAPAGLSAFVTAGIAAMAMLRRRKKS
jgi:hypothetical protein